MEQMNLFDFMLEESKVIKELQTKETNWLLVDGNNLLNRAYYATAQKLMTAPDGRYTNAVSLFIKMLLSYQKELNAHVAVMFDDGKSYRKDKYPPYKDGRNETPAQLEEQFPLIKEVLNKAEIPVFSDPMYEADDLIASAAQQVEGNIYILSNDRDLYQLISDRVTVIVRKNKEDVHMTPTQFSNDFEGLQPYQIVDLKALEGDKSDNIPGVEGIGGKGAFNLIKAFSSIEELIEVKEFPKTLQRYQSKLESGKENAVFFKELTTLHTDIPMTLNTYQMNKQACINICESLAIHSVTRILKNY
ncbi:MAG: 5'-3' exonuclease [Psychrobacillus sp.]